MKDEGVPIFMQQLAFLELLLLDMKASTTTVIIFRVTYKHTTLLYSRRSYNPDKKQTKKQEKDLLFFHICSSKIYKRE